MKILFLATKDFAYSNYVLHLFCDSDFFKNDEVLVIEQDTVLPGKSKFAGVKKYAKKAGVYYVVNQITKQYLFITTRFFAGLFVRRSSKYFPFYKNDLKHFSRETRNGLKSEENFNFIKDFAPDLIISAYSKEIIPENIIELPKLGALNVHPSDLPKYRGMAPVFRCLAYGEKEIGVTLYYIDKGVDTGEIIEKTKFSVKDFTSDHSLTMKCVEVGFGMVERFINKSRVGEKIHTTQNAWKDSKYYSIPQRKEVKQFRKRGYRFFKFGEFLW